MNRTHFMSWRIGETGHGITAIKTFSLLAAVTFMCLPHSAIAHGTMGAEVFPDTACALFSYDDGEPMGYTKVIVTAPETETPFQSAAPDTNGILCFAPDRPGSWKLSANDGMGHQHKISITVAADKPATVVSAGSGEMGTADPAGKRVRALAGIGIIFGFTGLFGWYRASSRLRRQSAGKPG